MLALRIASGTKFAVLVAKIIGDDAVSGTRCGDEEVQDPGGEGYVVDRPIYNAEHHDTVVPQPGLNVGAL